MLERPKMSIPGETPFSADQPAQPINTVPMFKAQSGLVYPEAPIIEPRTREHLDLSKTNLSVYKEDVDLLDNAGFALIRRAGFGGSDVSVLLNANPFTSLSELIKQKASKELSEEELSVGSEAAVIKGNDLEPLVLQKTSKVLDMQIIKPTDMYVYKDWNYLTMNFDGVAGTPEQYVPVECKIVTAKGERHYNPTSCIYDDKLGFKVFPDNISISNNSIATKASIVGIPMYYYCQLQDEMMALNAPFGFLTTLWEASWTLRIYMVYRDPAVQNAIVIQGFKAWEKVQALKNKQGGIL